MRDFLEDLGKRIGETAETMTNKAGEAIEIQRLKGQIRGLARDNAVDLMELGRAIYERYKAGEEVEEGAQALCDAIKDREASIGEYEKKISRIKGTSECGNCGKMVGREMSFCPYCGEKVTLSEEDETASEAETTEERSDDEAAESHADHIKEKMADAAESAAGKMDEAAKKVGDMAEKAAEKAGDMAEKAARKTGEMAEKAAGKINDAAEKVSDKLNEK